MSFKSWFRIFSLLSAILHLGNIRYKRKNRDDSIDICNPEVLPVVSELLEVISSGTIFSSALLLYWFDPIIYNSKVKFFSPHFLASPGQRGDAVWSSDNQEDGDCGGAVDRSLQAVRGETAAAFSKGWNRVVSNYWHCTAKAVVFSTLNLVSCWRFAVGQQIVVKTSWT